jgi:hypothetical protein
MNAPAEILSDSALDHAIEVLTIRAEVRSYLEYEHQYEYLADAVDPLQECAERSGLVTAIGQDAVQAIIAAPFARFRDIVAAEIEAEEISALESAPADLPLDYAAQIVRQWEMADPRDAWRHTGELPPAPKVERPSTKTIHRTTPQSTVDAFWCVIQQDNADYLARWLENHPLDVSHLTGIWEAKCSTAAA